MTEDQDHEERVRAIVRNTQKAADFGGEVGKILDREWAVLRPKLVQRLTAAFYRTLERP